MVCGKVVRLFSTLTRLTELRVVFRPNPRLLCSRWEKTILDCEGGGIDSVHPRVCRDGKTSLLFRPSLTCFWKEGRRAVVDRSTDPPTWGVLSVPDSLGETPRGSLLRSETGSPSTRPRPGTLPSCSVPPRIRGRPYVGVPDPCTGRDSCLRHRTVRCPRRGERSLSVPVETRRSHHGDS